MEIKKNNYSEVYVPVLAKHVGLLSSTKCNFADQKIKNIYLCGKYERIEEGNFFARISIKDHSGVASFISYNLTSYQKFFGLSDDLRIGDYAKAYCLARVEESEVTLVLKQMVKVTERAEVNYFLTEVLIHNLKPCGFRLNHLVLNQLSDAPATGLSAEEIQRKLSSYYSLYHIEKVLLDLTEEGQITIGEDFNKYCLFRMF